MGGHLFIDGTRSAAHIAADVARTIGWGSAAASGGVGVGGAASVKPAKVWSLDSGKVVKTFRGHSNWVLSVAFSAYGAYLATSSSDRTATLWSVAGGEVVKTFKRHSDQVISAAFSPDGNMSRRALPTVQLNCGRSLEATW